MVQNLLDGATLACGVWKNYVSLVRCFVLVLVFGIRRSVLVGCTFFCVSDEWIARRVGASVLARRVHKRVIFAHQYNDDVFGKRVQS